MNRPARTSTSILVLLLLTSTAAAAADLEYPPKLPGGAEVVTDRDPAMLKPPAPWSDAEGTARIAKSPPTIDFLYYPGQTYPGRPWSNWGDSLAVNGKYYSAIGDHLGPRGNAFVYEYSPGDKKIRLLVDVQKVIKMPAGHYTPGKIHSRIDMGSDGWLYFATHRGSTRVTIDKYHYKGDWILRHHPPTGRTEIVTRGPVPKHCIPTSVLDPKRLIFYGGTAAGNRMDPEKFFAYDIRAGKVISEATNGPYRYLIFARSTGRVYYVHQDGGPLMRFDPAKDKAPKEIPGTIGIRAATRETDDGFVYTVSTRRDGSLWRFNTKTEKIERIGNARVGGQDYVTSLEVDPTGRFLYYAPGAHGSGQRAGSPVVQYDVQKRSAKVLAFLFPFYQRKYGYAVLGTFGTALDAKGEKLYVTWNGNRGGRDQHGRWPFDTCAMTVIHIPAEER